MLQLHVLAQLAQVIHIEDLLPELEATGRIKGTGRHGWAHFGRLPPSPQQPPKIRQWLSPSMACPQSAWPPQVSGSEFKVKPGEAAVLPTNPFT